MTPAIELSNQPASALSTETAVFYRIRGEFIEMPGLRITFEQAMRLFGLDRTGCTSVLDALVGMGGAVTNIAAVKHGLETYDPELVQGTVLDVAELDRQIELFRTRSADERRAVVGLQPKRAEIILAGACVVRTVLGKLGRESLVVSDRGLRHRLLVERFGDRNEE